MMDDSDKQIAEKWIKWLDSEIRFSASSSYEKENKIELLNLLKKLLNDSD